MNLIVIVKVYLVKTENSTLRNSGVTDHIYLTPFTLAQTTAHKVYVYVGNDFYRVMSCCNFFISHPFIRYNKKTDCLIRKIW